MGRRAIARSAGAPLRSPAVGHRGTQGKTTRRSIQSRALAATRPRRGEPRLDASPERLPLIGTDPVGVEAVTVVESRDLAQRVRCHGRVAFLETTDPGRDGLGGAPAETR